MENKKVGWLLVGIAAFMIVIIFMFNSALRDVVKSSCTMEEQICPMYKTINQQTYLALAIAGVLVLVGLILMFTKQSEKIVIKTVKEKQIKKIIDMSSFRPEDKIIFKKIQEKGAVFQANLSEESGFGKAKVTRIIDRLEGKGLIERVRRGKTNVVVLKKE